VKNNLKPFVIFSSIFVQIILFAIYFYVNTSTIDWFPWYEPDTVGAALILSIIVPFQVVITLLIWELYDDSKAYKRIAVTSSTHFGLILFSIVLSNFYFFSSVLIFVIQLITFLAFIWSFVTFLRKPAY